MRSLAKSCAYIFHKNESESIEHSDGFDLACSLYKLTLKWLY